MTAAFGQIHMTGWGIEPIAFTNPPPASEWSTLSCPGSDATIGSPEALDTAVQATRASDITNALPTTGGIPPNANGLARCNTNGHYLQTKPAGNSCTMLLAQIENDTSMSYDNIVISYDYLALADPDAYINEEVPGQRVYWSLTGEPNSWNLIPQLSGVITSTNLYGSIVTTCLGFSWAPGQILYLLWADDNCQSATGEGAYTIDNFSLRILIVDSGCWMTVPQREFVQGMPIQVSADAGLPCETITNLALYVDQQLYASSATNHVHWTVTNLGLGQHSLYVLARGAHGTIVPSWTHDMLITVISNTLEIVTGNAHFGVVSNQFGFDVSAPISQKVVLEISPDLQHWTAVLTNRMTTNWFRFADTNWPAQVRSYYRARFAE